ncbi:MAG TPA: PDZ domain-containing protein [Gemmataceae bacterium]|jgi:membrane-associated protease RseP (regulator of RpoE activity)|nr:PDZ domain-containing protein [Gemmataceae bacterium]
MFNLFRCSILCVSLAAAGLVELAQPQTASAQPGRTFTPPPPPPPAPPRFEPPRSVPLPPTDPRSDHGKAMAQHQQIVESERQRRTTEQSFPQNNANPPVGRNVPAGPVPKVAIVAITGVEPDGKGQRLGLKTGDILLTYDGDMVESVKQFLAIRKGEPAKGPIRELTVRRKNQELSFDVPPGMLGIHLEAH